MRRRRTTLFNLGIGIGFAGRNRLSLAQAGIAGMEPWEAETRIRSLFQESQASRRPASLKRLAEAQPFVGIPDLARFTARLLAGQALGMVTMLLLVVRFLALGEALQRPGNGLSGLHQTLAFIWDFYLAMARVIF